MKFSAQTKFWALPGDQKGFPEGVWNATFLATSRFPRVLLFGDLPGTVLGAFLKHFGVPPASKIDHYETLKNRSSGEL